MINFTMCCAVPQLCPTLCDPVDYSPLGSLSMGFSRQEYWSRLSCPPPGDLPNPGTEAKSLALQADSLLSEPPGQPKNTGVGSLSLLQKIFPTQELNWFLLHCRWILYQLSYQGSPLYATVARKALAESLWGFHFNGRQWDL